MKAILEFNLPEESEEFETACNGMKYRLILSNVKDTLRSDLKHKELPEPVQDYIEKLGESISDEMIENAVLL